MFIQLRRLLLFLCFDPVALYASSEPVTYFDINYQVSINSGENSADVSIQLVGPELPSKLVFHLDLEHHQFSTQQGLEISKNKAIWRPQASPATLRYRYLINSQKRNSSFDAKITSQWAIFRSDKLIPPISTTASKHLASKATLDFQLPRGWSSAAPYPADVDNKNRYSLIDPGRRLIRPKGWLILGELASRQDFVGEVDVRVAAPKGQGNRLQDMLAFISWNLPALQQIFPDFPQHLLVVTAGDPMWLGGLSGTRSLFMHADRPLISGNRTSSLLHELVHVATGIRGDKESDWIVEGLAEFYSIEILRRTGGISQLRFEQTLEKLQHWGKKAPSLLVKRSSAEVTARAASLMHKIDQRIRKDSGGKASLDDVVRSLASHRGAVDLNTFSKLVHKAAGAKVEWLERTALNQ